jgi:hypothetical protein
MLCVEHPMMRAVLLITLSAVWAACLAGASSFLPPLHADRWVNSPQLDAQALRGKVVLVDFWEYTCVNWIRTSPYVKEWHRLYAEYGLVVIGVHAPEPGSSGRAAVNVLLDGKPVGEAHGWDVGADGVARFDRSGMIRLVSGAPRRRHVLTVQSSESGVRAYVFTFGP